MSTSKDDNSRTVSHDSCNNSSCSCGHHTHSASIRPVLLKTIFAGIFLLIALLAEAEIIQIPWIEIISAGIALLLTAYPILKEAITGLFNGERNVCELASIAIIAAILIGEFTVAAEVAIILTIGELIEDYLYARSKRDIDGIMNRNPRFGYIIRDEEIVQIPIHDIRVGDMIMVRPGDMVPVDGIVQEGGSCIDESCLTGESLPVEKKQGNYVYSGSINKDETLILKATKVSDDSTYAKIVALIRQAEQRRPPSHPFIDRFAKVYSPLMILIAAVVYILTGDIIRSITVLIVACPCALLLATPSAVLATIGSAAKSGILMKGGEFLEICKDITVLLLDKTGTITSGTMEISSVIPFGEKNIIDVLSHAALAECSSSHPVGKAIVAAALEKGIQASCSGNTRSYAGLGVEDHQNGAIVHVGNLQFMEDRGIPIEFHPDITPDEQKANNVVFVSVNHSLIGMITVADSVRPESPSVIASLKGMGLDRIEILTGDNQEIAKNIASSCNIPEKSVHAGMYPQDKEQYVAKLQKQGDVVCFVGDGTNDGPALARSNLGISIGSREDTVALETSSVILMQGGLSALPAFFRLGRRTSRIIIINVVLALLLNFTLIILAGIGILSPALGAVGHQVAVAIVLLNSARLAYTKEESGNLKNQHII